MRPICSQILYLLLFGIQESCQRTEQISGHWRGRELCGTWGERWTRTLLVLTSYWAVAAKTRRISAGDKWTKSWSHPTELCSYQRSLCLGWSVIHKAGIGNKQNFLIDFLLVLLLASRADTRPKLRVCPSLCLWAVRLLSLSPKISSLLCVQCLIWCLCPTFRAKERETLTRSLDIRQSINMRSCSRCLTRPLT